MSDISDYDDFDETWYLATYPDVAKAIANGVVKTAVEHYQLHGVREGRRPSSRARPDAKAAIAEKLPRKPVTLLHIPKTAGTSVRAAFEREKKSILDAGPGFKFDPVRHADIDLISGHIGYRQAAPVGGDIITLLRDPVDRFLSYYYHLRQLHAKGNDKSERALLAATYDIDEFVQLSDSVSLLNDLFNAVTWQLIYGTLLSERLEYRTLYDATDDMLLGAAMENLARFRIVGFQHQADRFCARLNDTYGTELALERENANPAREQRENLRRSTISKINDWVYLDLELYHWALTHLA